MRPVCAVCVSLHGTRQSRFLCPNPTASCVFARYGAFTSSITSALSRAAYACWYESVRRQKESRLPDDFKVCIPPAHMPVSVLQAQPHNGLSKRVSARADMVASAA